jgi:hypothetical protein
VGVSGVGVVKTTVTEHIPPSDGMLKWLMARRMPEYREEPKKHVTEVGAWLRASLEEMDERAKLQRAERAKLIRHQKLIASSS